MRSTVIVAAHNEGDLLLQTLRSVAAAADKLKYELIIADDQSSDGSVEAARSEFPKAHVVATKERAGAAGCKALGADHAKGEVLIFLDGHTKPEPGSLEALVKSVEDAGGDAIITPRVPTLDTAKWANNDSQSGHGYAISLDKLGCWWIPLGKMRETTVAGQTMYESPALIGCAMAISKALYTKLRGFDRDMLTWGVEDLDFGLKCWLMGGRILHNPDIAIGHRFRQSFTNFTVPMDHLLANQIRMARKNYTDSIWRVWLEGARRRHPGGFKEYPEGLWTRAWSVYKQNEASAEAERAYLMANRVHDELWYAERFGASWPKLEIPAVAAPSDLYTAAAFDEFSDDLAAHPSPSPKPTPKPGPIPDPSPTPGPAPTPTPEPCTCTFQRKYCTGKQTDGGYVGAQATIKVRYGKLCCEGVTKVDAYQVAYANVSTPKQPVPYGQIWAQTGWGRERNIKVYGNKIVEYRYFEVNATTYKVFYQTTKPPAQDSSHTYECNLDNSTGRWTFHDNGDSWGSFQNDFWKGKTLQFALYSTEICNKEDDMPGTADNKCTFTDCKYRKAGQAFVSTAFTAASIESDDAAEWPISLVSPTDFELWDAHPLP